MVVTHSQKNQHACPWQFPWQFLLKIWIANTPTEHSILDALSWWCSLQLSDNRVGLLCIIIILQRVENSSGRYHKLTPGFKRWACGPSTLYTPGLETAAAGWLPRDRRQADAWKGSLPHLSWAWWDHAYTSSAAYEVKLAPPNSVTWSYKVAGGTEMVKDLASN